MSGYVYQFGLTTLPGATGTYNVTAQAKRNLQRTLGGVYDPHGADSAELELPYTITVAAKAYQTTAQLLGAALDSYRAMVGKRDRLWLRPFDTTQVDRWCWARCVSVLETNAYNNRITQPLELVFEAISPWYGHAYGGYATFDSGYLFDSGLYFDSAGAYTLDGNDDITLTNAGNLTHTKCGITVTAGDIAVTSVTFVIASLAQLAWSGTLQAHKQLIIDCGSYTVLNDGADAYRGLTVGPNQYTAHWLPLEAGNTTVNVTCDGLSEGYAAPTVQFSYSDTWA